MRPRLKAAENLRLADGGLRLLELASMRPRLKAAENVPPMLQGRPADAGFNEAAA